MANLRKEEMIQRAALPPRMMLHEPRVAIYCRVSSDKQAREATIDRQLSLTEELFQRHFKGNIKQLVGRFYDEGYNLESKDITRHFWQLAGLIESGRVNTVIVVAEDRIFRGESAQLRGEITDLFRHNHVNLITGNNSTQYNRSETTTRLVSSITQELGAIQKLEAVKTLQHGRRRKLEEAERWYLSVTPYGLRCNRRLENHQKIYDYVIVEEEACYVRDIFRLYVGEPPECLPRPVARPLGAGRIAEILNQAKVDRSAWVASQPTGIGSPGWDRQKVLRIIKNSTYCGSLTVTFSPTDKVAGFADKLTTKTLTLPAIIDKPLFAKAQTIHQAKRDKLLDDYSPRIATNFLHGYIVCPVCDSRLVGRLANQGSRYYGCPKTTREEPHGLHRAEDIEEPVARELLRLFESQVDFNRLLRKIREKESETKAIGRLEKELASLDEQVSKAEARLEKLALGWSDGTIDDGMFRTLTSKIKKELTELNFRHQEAGERLSAQQSTKKRVEGLTQLRALLASSLADPSKRLRIFRLLVEELVEKIELKKLAEIDLSHLSSDEIKTLYLEGRITPRLLRGQGWSTRRIYTELGQSGRKTPKSVEPKIFFRF